MTSRIQLSLHSHANAPDQKADHEPSPSFYECFHLPGISRCAGRVGNCSFAQTKGALNASPASRAFGGLGKVAQDHFAEGAAFDQRHGKKQVQAKIWRARLGCTVRPCSHLGGAGPWSFQLPVPFLQGRGAIEKIAYCCQAQDGEPLLKAVRAGKLKVSRCLLFSGEPPALMHDYNPNPFFQRQPGPGLWRRSAGDGAGALQGAHPAAAELYENTNYQYAGLCRSPLETSLSAEQQARQVIERAMRPSNKGTPYGQS